MSPDVKVARSAVPGGENRILGLDGLRGMMTLFVVVSHYFGEVRHGVPAFDVAWIAVKMFFALSGFLVGRLILERMECKNFFAVFYVRRFCRTLPVYFVCVVLVYFCMHVFGAPSWMEIGVEFPLWSYLTFTQNFFMISADSVGPHWLSPTWTLSVEEQFYVFAPLLFVMTPRRLLLPVLGSAAALALLVRIAAFQGGLFTPMTALCTLPGNADSLFAGMFAAVLFKTESVDWRRHQLWLRLTPLVTLLTTFAIQVLAGRTGAWLNSVGFFLVSIGCAAFVLSIALGTPEARRFQSPILCFFGNTSYSVYLTHETVVGQIHGLALGTRPDIATPIQLALTVASLPISFFLGWVLTKIVEEPITAYGRTWRWSRSPRSSAAALASTP
jgi:peptidoglycan/LPS O-acetylase OafA/YrhL